MTEVKEEVKKEEGREFGFTLLVKADGSITLNPINVITDFELAGLIDYASQKKTELLQLISKSPEVKTIQTMGVLTNLISQMVEVAKKQIGVDRETDTTN